MIRFLAFWSLLLASTAAVANEVPGNEVTPNDVCVRNYNTGGVNPCENHKSMFVYAIATDEEMVFALCARKRPGQCNGEPPFRWIEGQEGGRHCVIDYNQQVTGNFCEAEQLKTYHYARSAE